MVPFFFALRDLRPWAGFRLGLIFGIVYFTGTVYWVTNSVHFYGGVPLIPASLITLLLCAYLALYPALFGAAAVHLRNNHGRFFFLAAPALWTALELARTYVFSGFPWSLARLFAVSRAARDTDRGHHRRLRRLVPDRAGERRRCRGGPGQEALRGGGCCRGHHGLGPRSTGQ